MSTQHIRRDAVVLLGGFTLVLVLILPSLLRPITSAAAPLLQATSTPAAVVRLPYVVNNYPPPPLPWGMFQHDPQHTGRSPYTGPQNASLRWNFLTAGVPGSSVIGSDGTIYLPVGMLNEDTVGYLYAINPDGTQKWRVQLAGPPSSTAPAIGSDGTIYVHCNGGEGNIVAVERLHAVSPNGAIQWTFEFNGGLGIFASSVQSSPAVASDGTIYIGSLDTKLYALNPNGTVKWTRSPTVSSMSSSPAVAPDGTIYIVDATTTLFAYSSSGTLRWSYQLSDSPVGTGNDQSPGVGADGTVYVGSPADNRLYAIRSDGSLRWRFTTGWAIRSTPAIGADGTIYLGSDGLYALNPNGAQKWKFNCFFCSFSSVSPVIGSDGTIYWRASWNFYALNTNGTQKWSLDVSPFPSQGLDSIPALGSDGTLYMPYANVFDPSQNGLRAYRTTP